MLRSLVFLAAAASTVVGFSDFPSPHYVPSGVVGIYAIVQRVQFEPNAENPDRMRIYGAFAFVNGGPGRQIDVSTAVKGQLYFSHPMGVIGDHPSAIATRREWNDIRAVAGTGQAIGFGNWYFSGPFSLDAVSPGSFGNVENAVPLRNWVRPDSARGASPIPYSTNAGIVKISETTHAVVRQLRAALGG